MAQHALLRQYISAGNNVPSLVFPRCTQWTKLFKKRKRSKKFAAFCLFVRAFPIDFALLGRKRKYIKIKDNSKIKKEKNIDRSGQRHIGNDWHLFSTPPSSLPTTFKNRQRQAVFRISVPMDDGSGSWSVSCSFLLSSRVADPDPGSGIRCLFDPWIRDLGSGIGFFRIPDPGSRIPDPKTIFLRA